MIKTSVLKAFAALSLAGGISVSSINAQEPPVGAIPLFGPWSGGVDIGGSYLSGNSDVQQIYAGIKGEREVDDSTLRLGLEGVYGKTNGIKDKEWIHGYTQYNYNFAEPFYGGLFTDFWHDEVADLSYRFRVNPLLGYYVFKNELSTLALEAGPAYVWQEQGGITDGYLALRFAQRYERKVGDHSRVWQSFEWTPEASDFGNYLLIGEAGIQTWVSPYVSVKAFAQNRYDSEPDAGKEENDLGVFLALSYGAVRPDVAAEAGESKPDDAWKFSGTAGATMLSGNTDSDTFTAALDGARRWDGREAGVGTGATYAKTAGVKTAQQVATYGFYNYDISERAYAGVRIDGFHDTIADLDYRVTVGPHFGYRVIDTDRTQLKLEAGPGYTFEKQSGISDTYMAYRFGESLEHQFNDTFKVFQSFNYTGSFDDSDDYLMINKVGFDAALWSGWAWTSSYVHTYDNTPAAGLKDTDTAIVSGLKWTF